MDLYFQDQPFLFSFKFVPKSYITIKNVIHYKCDYYTINYKILTK